jgi:hypothetical protein
MRTALALVGVGLWLVGSGACSPPNIAGDPLKGATTGEAFEGVQCSAVRPQTEPDLMAWDPGSRSNLNRLRREGVVAVRYEAKGCNVELELLSNCIGTASKYGFSPYSANERKVAHNANELFAQLPVGAARLAGSVKGTRALRTDYMMAGLYAVPAGSTFNASDLRGDCARATHIVSAVYVGGFAMGAGESRSVEASTTLFGVGGGGKSTADVEVLGDEGNAEACKTSQIEGKENERCAVPLRIGLLAIDRGPSPQASPPQPSRSALPAAPGPSARRASAPPSSDPSSSSEFWCYLNGPGQESCEPLEMVCGMARSDYMRATGWNPPPCFKAPQASCFQFSDSSSKAPSSVNCFTTDASCRTAFASAKSRGGLTMMRGCQVYTTPPAGSYQPADSNR